MRILRIADVADNRVGGMSRAIHLTSDCLRNRGHHIDHLFGEQIGRTLVRQFRRFVVPVRVLSLVREAIRSGGRYDLVEIHEPSAAVYCCSRLWDSSLPPAVIFSHGLEERGLAASIAFRRMKGLGVSLKQRTSPYSVVGQAMFAVRQADHVVCCSLEDVDHLAVRGVPRHKLTHYQNGVSNVFLSDTEPLGASANMLYLGSWLERKGVSELASAISSVLVTHPQIRFTAAGCGAGTEDLVRQNFSPNLRSRVDVVPFADGDRALASLYRRHGVFILPSVFEGQPLVMLEAAASGLAIVTTNTCGMKDFILHGRNGLLVPVGDTDALTSAIDNVVADQSLRHQLGVAAKNAARLYTWMNSALRLEKAYESAIKHVRETAEV